ncbi:MAG TPA: restriction endonuclease subunit R [Allocoleopsis sp.]
MVQTLEASKLSLNDVYRLLKIEKQYGGSFSELLHLEHLTEFQYQEILRIRNDFKRYNNAGKISEGIIKFLILAPLMRLTGFFDIPIKISIEDSIPVSIECQDKIITGRKDILAVNSANGESESPLWILVIETKNSAVDALEGLPQLLTYAFKSLENQTSVWGLSTNGKSYRFIHLKRGNPATYQVLPELNLIDEDRAIELVKVFQAICQLQIIAQVEAA